MMGWNEYWSTAFGANPNWWSLHAIVMVVMLLGGWVYAGMRAVNAYWAVNGGSYIITKSPVLAKRYARQSLIAFPAVPVLAVLWPAWLGVALLFVVLYGPYWLVRVAMVGR